MPAKQTMVLLQEQKSAQASPCAFWVSQAFGRNDDASPRRYVPQDVWCSAAGNSPFSHPWLPSSKSFIPTTRLGDVQSPPFPHPHTGYAGSNQAAMAGDLESDSIRARCQISHLPNFCLSIPKCELVSGAYRLRGR